jgi:hypothetical protein|tara:strand:+ start:326 stop:436 length:111 start_codon:yes stop_codon:yes gene_type:complete
MYGYECIDMEGILAAKVGKNNLKRRHQKDRFIAKKV